MKVQIDNEFKELLPRLSQDEFAQLEQSLIDDGCRDPLVVWGDSGILLDGHNRFEICIEHAIGFNVKELELETRQDAYNWIINNQLGRRNLTPEQASYLRGKRYNAEKRQGARKDITCDQNDHKLEAERIGNELGVSAPTIRRDGQFAAGIDAIGAVEGDDAKQSILAGHSEFTKAEVEEIGRAARKSIDDAREIIKGRPHVVNNSGNNEWYTPQEYIDAARAVLGNIDLDPASSIEANEIVKAKKFYTIDDNGLEQEWRGNVWMNPPYASDLIHQFCHKLFEYVQDGKVKSAIVLVNNATETKWFCELVAIASIICFPASRVRFWMPGGKTGAPLQGQAVLYIGDNGELFNEHFAKFGWIATL